MTAAADEQMTVSALAEAAVMTRMTAVWRPLLWANLTIVVRRLQAYTFQNDN